MVALQTTAIARVHDDIIAIAAELAAVTKMTSYGLGCGYGPDFRGQSALLEIFLLFNLHQMGMLTFVWRSHLENPRGLWYSMPNTQVPSGCSY